MATMSSTRIESLFGYLDGLMSRPDTLELADVLRRTAVTLDDVAEYVRFNDQHYVRNLVRGGAEYHALAICWRSGQRSPIHDHARSVCGVRVLAGKATETRFKMGPGGSLEATGSFDMSAGHVMVSQDSDVHQVSNLQPEGEDLVTLHIYAPPLLRMATYSIRGGDEVECVPTALEHCESACR